MAVKITFINGVVSVYEFANAVKNNLKEEGFEFVNVGYEAMSDKTRYQLRKDIETLEEFLLPKKMTKEDVKETLNRIKEVKNSYTPIIEEIEFDL